jgi:hypothetical protein
MRGDDLLMPGEHTIFPGTYEHTHENLRPLALIRRYQRIMTDIQ